MVPGVPYVDSGNWARECDSSCYHVSPLRKQRNTYIQNISHTKYNTYKSTRLSCLARTKWCLAFSGMGHRYTNSIKQFDYELEISIA